MSYPISSAVCFFLISPRWSCSARYTTRASIVGGDPKELIAVGTNAMATSAMMKAGAVKAATGENPVVVNTSGADFVVGPIGIIAADALLGEITPKMAQAVASCTAQKVLLPVNTCMFHVVGVSDNRLSDNIDEAISYILQNK